MGEHSWPRAACRAKKNGRRAGITCPRETVVNLLDTQIALVEANQGIALGPLPK
jgi:hypothetical protein